jgi:hypothetical protein
MVPPAGRLTGSVPAFTANALLEVLNCAICTEDVPGFVIDKVRDTGVPKFTLPKSMEDGLAVSAGTEVDDENG